VNLLGSISGAVGALGVRWVLKAYAFPQNFAILFVWAGVIMSACITAFFWLREPPNPEVVVAEDRPFLTEVAGLLRGSPDFMWYMGVRFVAGFGIMGDAFCAVAAMERFDLDVEAAATFAATLLVARVIGSLIAGRMGDAFGFKLVMVVSAVFSVCASIVAIWAPTVGWFYLAFACMGVRQSVGMIAVSNLTIEFCPTSDKTTFVAIASTIMCPAYVVAPIIGGQIAHYHPARFNAVFTVAAVCSALALVMLLLFVREPRRVAESIQ